MVNSFKYLNSRFHFKLDFLKITYTQSILPTRVSSVKMAEKHRSWLIEELGIGEGWKKFASTNLCCVGSVFFRRYFAISERGTALHFSPFVNCSCTWTSCARRHMPSSRGWDGFSSFLKSFRSWHDSGVLMLTRYRVQTTLELKRSVDPSDECTRM